jgi:creatinine amidohydrolase
VLLALSTWREVEVYLGRCQGIVVPIGSTEQHGPMGLIGTDWICAEAIAQGVGERAGALVGPTLALGANQFNLAFPGTISLRATTLMALVTDYVESLARRGFRRFYLLNGHGGNVAPVRAAFQDLHLAQTGLHLRLRSWWELPAANALRLELYGASEGMHATPSEVAITQHVQPDRIKQASEPAPEPLSAAFMRDHAGDQHREADHHRKEFPDGRVGSDSSLAAPEHGARLLEAAIADAITDYRALLAET